MSDILKRGTGLIIIEVINSNPNGDPDRENDPRMRPDGRGEISSVSFKRKLRDLVFENEGPVWEAFGKKLEPKSGLKSESELEENKYEIMEQRGKKHKDLVKEATAPDFLNNYWDARVFGNTILQEKVDTPIQTGVAQFGLGVSVSPIAIERMTTTKTTPVQENKSRGMAPLAFRVVQHGVYCMPFFINATMAKKTKCTTKDIKLLLDIIPYAYVHTASYLRSQVNIRHAFYIEHASPLGSFNDFELIEKLTPQRIDSEDRPSISWKDYDIEKLKKEWTEVQDLVKKKSGAKARDLVEDINK